MKKTVRYLVILVLLLIFSNVMYAEIRVSADDAMKAAVNKPQPEYNPVARQMRVSGTVQVEVHIAVDGTVEEVKITSGNALLTANVVSTLKKWTFKPFTTNGDPTKAVATLSFDFKS
jgi:TonB family protein